MDAAASRLLGAEGRYRLAGLKVPGPPGGGGPSAGYPSCVGFFSPAAVSRAVGVWNDRQASGGSGEQVGSGSVMVGAQLIATC